LQRITSFMVARVAGNTVWPHMACDFP